MTTYQMLANVTTFEIAWFEPENLMRNLGSAENGGLLKMYTGDDSELPDEIKNNFATFLERSDALKARFCYNGTVFVRRPQPDIDKRLGGITP